MQQTEQETNKAVVVRFNKEVIEAGNREAFEEIMGEGSVNRSAPPSMDSRLEGM